MSKYEWRKVDTVPVEYVEDEHDESRDFQPSFWYWNRRYYLEDFVRVHGNPWIYDDYPEEVQGMEADEYYHPLFIGYDEALEAVTIYEEVES